MNNLEPSEKAVIAITLALTFGLLLSVGIVMKFETLKGLLAVLMGVGALTIRVRQHRQFSLLNKTGNFPILSKNGKLVMGVGLVVVAPVFFFLLFVDGKQEGVWGILKLVGGSGAIFVWGALCFWDYFSHKDEIIEENWEKEFDKKMSEKTEVKTPE